MEVCKKKGEFIWLPEDELDSEHRYIPRDKHPTKFMVWCGISYDGRTGVHVYPAGTKVNAKEYIQTMEDQLLPSVCDPNGEYLFPNGEPTPWVYMQDGAGCHRAKKVTKWLRDELPGVWTPSVQISETSVAKWPSNSPDLNPIENLWNFFQDAVVEKNPRTTEEFKKVIQDVWWEIPQDYIRNLYHSMPHRLAAVIANEGAMTKY
jgi:hypothetical protein